MSAIFKKLVSVILAVFGMTGLAACTNGDTQANWVDEVTKAGFSDPVMVSESSKSAVLMASVGTCRLRFVADVEASRLYVTVPGSPLGQDDSFVGDPSAALLRGDERFAVCFSEEEKQS